MAVATIGAALRGAPKESRHARPTCAALLAPALVGTVRADVSSFEQMAPGPFATSQTLTFPQFDPASASGPASAGGPAESLHRSRWNLVRGKGRRRESV